MPNYSLRLRPIYGQDETTGGQRIQQGISSALQQWQADQDAERAERNQVAQMGGTPIAGSAPTTMGRLRGIGGAINRVLGRGRRPAEMTPADPITDAGTGEVTQQGLQTGTDMARDGFGASRTNPPLFGAPTSQIDAKGRVRGTSQFPTQMQPGSTATMATPPAQPGRAAWDERVPTANPGQPTPARGIAGAISPYTFEGRGGQNYTIDPMRQQRLAVAGHEMEADAADQRTIATEQRHQAQTTAVQNQQIEALTQAGMPPSEARARVLTGTVRYDETFGQYRPNNGNLTYDQRRSIEQMREDNQYKIAQMRANGQTNSSEYRQAMLALQTAQVILSSGNAQATGFERTAAGAQRDVPTDPIGRTIAEGTPEGKARVQAAESTANANRDSAARVRGTAAATADSIARSVGRGMRPDDTGAGGRRVYSQEQTVARAQELKASGKTKQQVYEQMKQEGYNVAPPKGPPDLTGPAPRPR